MSGECGMRPVEQVIAALQRQGKRVRTQGGGWIAHCPAHEDRHATLSIREEERGQALGLAEGALGVGH